MHKDESEKSIELSRSEDAGFLDKFLAPIKSIAFPPDSGEAIMQRFGMQQSRLSFIERFHDVGKKYAEYFLLLAAYAYDYRKELQTGNHHFVIRKTFNPFQEGYQVKWVDEDENEGETIGIYQRLQFHRKGYSNILDSAQAQFGTRVQYGHTSIYWVPPRILVKFDDNNDLTGLQIRWSGVPYPSYLAGKRDVFQKFLGDYFYSPTFSTPQAWDGMRAFLILISAAADSPVKFDHDDDVGYAFNRHMKCGFSFSPDPNRLARVFSSTGQMDKYLLGDKYSTFKTSKVKDMRTNDLLNFTDTSLGFFPTTLIEYLRPLNRVRSQQNDAPNGFLC